MTRYIMKISLNNDLVCFFKGVVLSTLVFMLTACEHETETPKQPMRTVRVARVSANTLLVQRHFTGRIEAVSTVDLSFQVPGRMIAFPAQEGLFIAQGKMIAALDNNDYRLAVAQAQAQYDLAKLDVVRKRNLFKSRSLPKSMLDQAETQYTITNIALQTAKRNLSYTQITAPFDALVSQRLVDNYTNIAAYQKIVRVQDLTELRVHINIPEQMVKWLKQTERFNAVAVFNDRPKQYFPLSYREHATEAGSVAQTYEVVFGLSREKNQHVLPGMTVTVIISKKVGAEAAQFTVPVTAIDYDAQGKPNVWIFDAQSNTVHARPVVLGALQKYKIPVLSGLHDGEHIVTAGAHLLREGMTVRRFVAF